MINITNDSCPDPLATSINWWGHFCGCSLGVYYDPMRGSSDGEGPEQRMWLAIKRLDGSVATVRCVQELLELVLAVPETISESDRDDVCSAISYFLGFGKPVSKYVLETETGEPSLIEQRYGPQVVADVPRFENGVLLFFPNTLSVHGDLLFRVTIWLRELSMSIELVAGTISLPPQWSFPGRRVPISTIDGFWFPGLLSILEEHLSSTHPEVTS